MDWEFNELLKNKLKQHLRIGMQWFGDPKDSSFGISISLFWDNELITGGAVNFIGE